MPFAASDSLPHLCGACWHPKDAHAPAGDCPPAVSKRLDVGTGSLPAPADRAPR